LEGGGTALKVSPVEKEEEGEACTSAGELTKKKTEGGRWRCSPEDLRDGSVDTFHRENKEPIQKAASLRGRKKLFSEGTTINKSIIVAKGGGVDILRRIA